MSIKMRVAVLFVVSYFSGSKMGGSDNDIIFVSALGKIQVRRKCFQFGRDLEFNCMFRFKFISKYIDHSVKWLTSFVQIFRLIQRKKGFS